METEKNLSFEISLNNLRFFAYHGVLDFERESGNEFIVNLTVKTPFDIRVGDDDLAGTVSYADLYQIVSDVMATPKKLLEKVAYEIAALIKEKYPVISSGFITIEKVHPPIPGILGSASVRLNF